jgi:hypothetical protein
MWAVDQIRELFDILRELLDRNRRMETRLTKFMMAQGFETGVQKPSFNPLGSVELPSPACAMKDILEAIPPDWKQGEPIILMHKGTFVAELYRDP